MCCVALYFKKPAAFWNKKKKKRKKKLSSDVGFEILVQMLLGGWAVFALNFFFSPLLCIHLSSSIRLLPFKKSNTLIQTNHLSFSSPPPPPIFSPSSQSAGNCVTSCENKVNNILVRHSSPSFLNNFLKLQWLWAQSDSPLLPIQCHFPAYKPTPLVHSVSWLLWSSPTDIKLHTNDHPAIANSSSQRIQTSSHLASETADTTVYLLSFLSKNSQICQLTQYLSQNSLWDPNRTAQARNATVPAPQWRRHQHGKSLRTRWAITLCRSLYFESFF